MNIHEFKAKELIAESGVSISALTIEESVAAAKPLYLVRAQIHAGGRGKGKFNELGPMPKAECASPRRSRKSKNAPRKCWATLVTIQTGDARQKVVAEVNKVA